MGQKNLPFHPSKLSTSGKPLCAVVKTELVRQAWILAYIVILHNQESILLHSLAWREMWVTAVDWPAYMAHQGTQEPQSRREHAPECSFVVCFGWPGSWFFEMRIGTAKVGLEAQAGLELLVILPNAETVGMSHHA